LRPIRSCGIQRPQNHRHVRQLQLPGRQAQGTAEQLMGATLSRRDPSESPCGFAQEVLLRRSRAAHQRVVRHDGNDDSPADA